MLEHTVYFATLDICLFSQPLNPAFPFFSLKAYNPLFISYLPGDDEEDLYSLNVSGFGFNEFPFVHS